MFNFAAHTAFDFKFTFSDAPLFVLHYFTPGCVVPPYPGLFKSNPFREKKEALFYFKPIRTV